MASAIEATKGTAYDQLITGMVSNIEFGEYGIRKKVTPDGVFYPRHTASMENGVIKLTRTWVNAIT